MGFFSRLFGKRTTPRPMPERKPFDLRGIARYMPIHAAEPAPRPTYDGLSDSLWWPDEIPPISAEVDFADHSCLKPVLRYRTSLITGEPDERCRAAWDEAQRLFPNWIGFAPSRREGRLKEDYIRLRRTCCQSLRDFEARYDAKSPAKGRVRFDDTGVTSHLPDGTVQIIRWADLRGVVIRTTSDGPFVDDVFWLLHGENDECVVPSESDGVQELMKRLDQLPGFDNEAATAAMTSTEDREFVCWKKPENG